MKPISKRILCWAGVLVLLPVPALALQKLLTVPYHDPAGALHFSVPEGWKVRTVELNGKRQWKVVPRKADERERAAIRIWITLRTRVPKGFLDQAAHKYKTAEGDREAARSLSYNATQGHLVADYREGQYVSGDLWLVRRNLLVYQKNGKGMIEARCSSTDAEFNHYKRQLNLVCGSIKAGR